MSCSNGGGRWQRLRMLTVLLPPAYFPYPPSHRWGAGSAERLGVQRLVVASFLRGRFRRRSVRYDGAAAGCPSFGRPHHAGKLCVFRLRMSWRGAVSTTRILHAASRPGCRLRRNSSAATTTPERFRELRANLGSAGRRKTSMILSNRLRSHRACGSVRRPGVRCGRGECEGRSSPGHAVVADTRNESGSSRKAPRKRAENDFRVQCRPRDD